MADVDPFRQTPGLPLRPEIFAVVTSPSQENMTLNQHRRHAGISIKDEDAYRTCSTTASSVLRLCCVSAALRTAVSSSSEDPVDIVTLGAIQPPLAGQTRPAGISSSSKGWGSRMQDVESESLQETLNRLLRHTLDLDAPVESPFDEQRQQRRQQSSAVLEEEDANMHWSGENYSEHVEQDTLISGGVVRQPKSTGRKTSGANAPFADERENVFDVGDGCGNSGGDMEVPAGEGQNQSEPEDASFSKEVMQEEHTLDASHHDVDGNTAADVVGGSSLLDLDSEKVAGDRKWGNFDGDDDDSSDGGSAASAKISSGAPDVSGGGNAPQDPECVDDGDPAVATSFNDTDVSELATQVKLSVVGAEGALHPRTAEGADTVEWNVFAEEEMTRKSSFPRSDADDDRETCVAEECLVGERSFFGDGGTGQVDGLVEESRVVHGERVSEQAASADVSSTIVEEIAAPTAHGVTDHVDEQIDGRGVGATDNVPRIPLQTTPTLDNESIGAWGSRGRTAELIADSEAEDPESNIRAEVRHVAESSDGASSTPTAVFQKLESEKAAEGGQKDTSDAVGDASTEGHTVVAEGGDAPLEVVEILERFQGAGEAEDVDRTYEELRSDATEDGSGSSHGSVFGIDEPLEEFAQYQRPADVMLPLASEQAPISPVVEVRDGFPEDPASNSAASNGVPPSSDDALGLATNRSEDVESRKMGGSAADGAKTRGPRKLPVFGKPAPKTGPLGGGAGSSDNSFAGKRSGMGRLNLPVDDPSAWTLPPLPTMDGVPSGDREGEGRDRSSGQGAVVEMQEGSLWRSWGKNAAREAKKYATRWAKVAGETGVAWGQKAFELFRARALKLWRDHFREPSERASRRLDAFGRYVLDEVGEYMADPVLAELL